jgi:DNA repair exonuclease SbcCD ATPase subunit
MLAGRNGSGKSALFDAVTYSLYAQHRAGKANARNLIHKSCDSFVVEFDFRLDDRLYRARRTLSQSGRPSRQIYERQEPPDRAQSTQWEPIPWTNTESGFTRWVHDHIALTYDTFTTSILLLQGKADRFLTSAPAHRHALLAHVVGLDRFLKVHERAKTQLASAHGILKQLREQRASLPRVTKQERQRAVNTLEHSKARLATLSSEVETTNVSMQRARQWVQICHDLEQTQQQIGRIGRQLEGHSITKRRQQRWQLLTDHLDNLLELLRHRRALDERCRAKQQLASDRESVRQQLTSNHEHSEGEMRRVAQEHFKDLSQRKHEKLLARNRLDLVFSPLTRLASARDRMRRASRERRIAKNRLPNCVERRDSMMTSLAAEDKADQMERLRSHAVRQLAEARAVLVQARSRRKRFRSIIGEQRCRYCQQSLPQELVNDEERRLSQDLDQAMAEETIATQHVKSAEANYDFIRKQQVEGANKLGTLGDEIRQLEAAVQHAQREEREYERICGEAFDELPREFQQRVSTRRPPNWTDSTYPTAVEVQRLHKARNDLDEQIDEIDQEERSQEEALSGLLSQQQRMTKTRMDLERHLEYLTEQAAKNSGEIDYHRERFEALVAALPPDWRGWTLSRMIRNAACMSHERKSLMSMDINKELADVSRLREQHQQLTARLDTYHEQVAQIPPNIRKAPQDVQRELEGSRNAYHDAEAKLREAIRAESRLAELERQRESLDKQLKLADRNQYLWQRLTELLGRDGIQQTIIFSTERAIVEYANAILDRLAGGQLHLELRPSNGVHRDRKAFDLVVRNALDHRHSLDVAFLSGSQKFRVAVAISLAIGQFASFTRRPVQAIIIDEGFGCLDSINRQVMIQELQNLKTQLSRILIVSHQEEFTSAFSDGYRCELIDGAARLTPFHR